MAVAPPPICGMKNPYRHLQTAADVQAVEPDETHDPASARLPRLNDIEELKSREQPGAERKEGVKGPVLTAARFAEHLRGQEHRQSRKVSEPIEAQRDSPVADGSGELGNGNTQRRATIVYEALAHERSLGDKNVTPACFFATPCFRATAPHPDIIALSCLPGWGHKG